MEKKTQHLAVFMLLNSLTAATEPTEVHWARRTWRTSDGHPMSCSETDPQRHIYPFTNIVP